ncbi:DUF6880 family protein [Pseudofrankia sp. BMG5.37]|uniref:SWIM zinc finger family protein n=1 Tax=Pseudofrankia sp. BMG5.37 TaxID=3050035 RepID=UPI00289437F8|nr:DUF6880 family protein [Pseudofrankia sp. BMG5.37]MDT3441466.1 hypothetical protein [Pseudofrankia sp. BMG5.37]
MTRLVLDSAIVRDLAGELYYDRGVDYHRRGAVIKIVVDGTSAEATVFGTRTYRVRAELGRDGLTAECSCPLGRDGEFCKHAVATVLEWLEMAGDEPPAAEVDVKPAAGLPDWLDPESDAGPGGLGSYLAAAGQRRDADLAAFLTAQPREWLVERLLLVARRDPKLRAEWEALASRSSPSGVDLAGFRRQLEMTLTPPRNFEWGDAWDYVTGAQEILGSIDTFTEEGMAAAAVELAEEAMRLIDEAVEIVDQDGETTGLLDSAQEVHLRACEAARPEPVALAERMTRLAIDSQWDVFTNLAADYAEILGDAGLRRHKELVEASWAALPDLRPGDRSDYSSRRSTLERLRLGFTLTVAEQVETLSKDLATADRFLRIANVLSADGQFDEALRWLREADKEFPERYDQRVGHATAEILRRAGRPAEAADVEWECFRARPSLPTYQRFAEQLRPLPGWDQWRARAVELLERPAASGPWPAGEVHAGQGNTQLVDVLLWEGDPEAAWAAAERGGCDRGAWLRLARARAATHPVASIPILVREIDQARSGASDRRAYAAVARLVRELGTWHQRAGTEDAYRAYALRLRQDHRNRPAFQDELNLAGVPRP